MLHLRFVKSHMKSNATLGRIIHQCTDIMFCLGPRFFFNGIINVLTPNRVMLFLYEVDIFVAIDDDREEVESYFLTFGTRVDLYTEGP